MRPSAPHKMKFRDKIGVCNIYCVYSVCNVCNVCGVCSVCGVWLWGLGATRQVKIKKMTPSFEKIRPACQKMRPTFEKMRPIFQKIRPTHKKMRPACDICAYQITVLLKK